MGAPLSRRATRTIIGRIGIYTGVLALLIWIVFPLYWLFLSSVVTRAELGKTPPDWIPHAVTFDNFRVLFGGSTANTGYGSVVLSGAITSALLNSFIVAIGVTLIAIISSGLAAYVLSRFRSPATDVARVVLVAARAVPALAMIVPFYIIMRTLHVINTPTALIASYLVFTIPLCVWLLKAYIDTVPIELEEAAKLDGAHLPGIFIHVLLPVIAPGLVGAAVLAFLESWGEFFFALVLTNQLTMPPNLAALNSLQQVDWNVLAAGGVLTLLPPMILTFIFQKYIVSGLGAGAIR